MTKRINLLFIICVFLLPFISLSNLSNGEFFKPQAINNLSENCFDYIVIGSSRGLTTVNTNLIDSVTGMKGYNASLDGQGINSWLIMLNHIIDNEIQFDTLIICFDAGSETTEEDSQSKNSYRWHSELNKSYVYTSIFQDNEFKYPLIFFHYWKNNKSLLVSDFYRIFYPSFHYKFDNHGNYTYPTTFTTSINRKKTKYDLDLNKSNQLEEILSICNEKGVHVILYIAPYRHLDVEIDSKLNYRLINHSSIITDNTLFYDDIHVNSIGRNLSTLELIKDLTEN